MALQAGGQYNFNDWLMRQALGGISANPTGFNPNMMAANASMPNPNMGGGIGGFMRRASVGLQNGLGKVGQGLFPVDETAAAGMSPDQIRSMRNNAMMQMGLGMMASSSQGGRFGESLANGLGRAQQGLAGAMQRGFENATAARQEQRQMQRDSAADERFDKQYERQVAREDRLDDRDQRNFDHQLKQEELIQKRFEAQQQTQAEQFERRMQLAQAKSNGVSLPKPPAGYRWKDDGSQEPIPGGPADPSNKTGNYQEAERTAAFLGTRLANAMSMLKGISAEDQKPGVMETGARELGSEMGANWLRSEDRQKANAAQRDALDAALTLATGAAYTAEQIDAMRVSYFPQIGDTPDTQAQKKQSFDMLLQAARVKAGRASTAIDEALGRGATGKWTVEEE